MFGDISNIAYNVSIDTTELNRKYPLKLFLCPVFKNEYNESLSPQKQLLQLIMYGMMRIYGG